MRIVIEVGGLSLAATLDDSLTAREIFKALPLESTANVWGQEIYFDTPVMIDQAANAVETVAVGTLAYWPAGSAFCIFFGPTPVSTDEQPRAYSAVNVFGRLDAVPEALKDVPGGAAVKVSAA